MAAAQPGRSGHGSRLLGSHVVDVGLALPQYDYPVPGVPATTWETVAGSAQAAERLGFSSLWLADHISMGIERYGGPPGEFRGVDPITGLSALSRITSTITLGTLVCCCQLRPVTVLAKQLAGIDLLSGGRLVVGMGAGWHEPDYIAAGVPFLSAGRRLQELSAAVDALRIVWRGDPGAPPCHPPPVQVGGPPVWIGGRGDRLLEVVARHADGWNMVWVATVDAYRQRVAVLERACGRVDRDPATVTRSRGLFTLVGEDEADLRRRFERLRRQVPTGVLDGTSLEEWRTGRLVGSVDQVREQIDEWGALGVTHLVVGLGAVPFQGTSLDDIEMVASACR